MKLKLKVLSEKFCISRLNRLEPIPNWTLDANWYSITKTDEELSIVCEEKYVPEHILKETDWKCFKIEGPLDFALIGILSKLSTLLADSGISIFAISTYDTDYILVKSDKLAKSIKVFESNGISIIKE